jgi:hypothetical protein
LRTRSPARRIRAPPRFSAATQGAGRLDAFATIRVTDLLAELFVGTSSIARAARGAAMCALDACAPARRFLAAA